MTHIIQWNIRGVFANLEELQLLCREHQPAVLALQETLLKPEKDFSLSGYNFVGKAVDQTEHGTSGGVGLLVEKSLLYSPVILDTSLQAVAVRVTLHKTITICSVYLSPSIQVRRNDLLSLIEQLPKPFLLLGSFSTLGKREFIGEGSPA